MTVAQLEKINKIDQDDVDQLTKIMLSAFMLRESYKSSARLRKKERLLDSVITALTKFLEVKYSESEKKRLEMIKILSKLQMQKELLEIKKGEVQMKDIKAAAKKLGKKSQSAFSSK